MDMDIGMDTVVVGVNGVVKPRDYVQAAQAGVVRRMGVDRGHQYELAGLMTSSKAIVAATLVTTRGALVEVSSSHHIRCINIFVSAPDAARIAFMEAAHGLQDLANRVIPDVITWMSGSHIRYIIITGMPSLEFISPQKEAHSLVNNFAKDRAEVDNTTLRTTRWLRKQAADEAVAEWQKSALRRITWDPGSGLFKPGSPEQESRGWGTQRLGMCQWSPHTQMGEIICVRTPC
jgi:hypothetical protein